MNTFPSWVVLAADAPLQLTVGGGSSAMKLFFLMTVLSFATALLVSVTSFTRIAIVLSFLRQAMGTPQLPPNQVLLALSLALSGFVMAPVASRVYNEALGPYWADKMGENEALTRGSAPLREFMLRQTRPDDLRLFYDISEMERPTHADAIPMTIAVPAFMVSELTTAFRMGLFIFLPLILVDLLVSTILMSLGMMMVPPTLVSLPLKIGVFLLADGWHLVAQSLLKSFCMNNLPGPLVNEALVMLATTGGPIFGALLAVGLLVGILQATTQINDPAVGALPRLATALGMAFLLGGWMVERLSGFFVSAMHRMALHPF